MRITKEAARELIRSDFALTKGLPSDAFMDETMEVLREYGFWQLTERVGISYTSPGMCGEFDSPGRYELETL